jgi:hypothetical protein
MEFIECPNCHSLYHINAKQCDYCRTQLNKEKPKPIENIIKNNRGKDATINR